MPSYDYRCDACRHVFTRVESISAHGRKPVTCPKCKSPRVSRVYSPFYAKTVKKS